MIRSDDGMPHILFTPDGQMFTVYSQKGVIHLSQEETGSEAHFSGRFADAVCALIEGCLNTSDMLRLQMLAKSQPWLAALPDANTRPSSVARVLLGDGGATLFLEVTDRCNEYCLHCYADAGPERTDVLSLDDIRCVLADASRLGCSIVQFTGGDPLLHPHLPECAIYARELGYEEVEIYTNGLHLSSAMLERLAPTQPSFAFSIYSHDADTHDQITRVPGSHRRTVAAIRHCRQNEFDVRVGVILMPENKGQERDIGRFLHDDIGLDNSDFGFDTVKGSGRGAWFDYTPDLEMPDPDTQDATGGGDAPPAHAHGGKLCVAASGNVYPCIFSRHALLGNIHETPLSNIISALDHWRMPAPSAARWNHCLQAMTCSDCQIIAYALGEGERLALPFTHKSRHRTLAHGSDQGAVRR